ncbi:ImmA/IrrE family metallo-endopeptidase [Bacillus sp. J14TS2]|uniref:ImmA/IrrE family metallo-endopeptidase n=1 Tax=Bacillus sp. J14TS2 TaxID=2807188 RepID=UPI001B168257|nr:ImmA/IrrE family metallo-endopeptidase [Bacillus sp. J14TS2]GIN71186.1 ImmA/IrrE family metallo-endopeptidase [Bacillus sp. J14TS2]
MPKNTAIQLMKKYNTNNPFELAEHKKINVVTRALHEDIGGFYLYMRKSQYIFLNSSLSEEETFFVGAHELGHALQHTRVSTPFLRKKTLFSVDKIEVEANKFAVELLMPDCLLQEYIHLSIYDIAKILMVPREVVYLKKF